MHLGCRHGNIKGSCNDRQITRERQSEKERVRERGGGEESGGNGGITRDQRGLESKIDEPRGMVEGEGLRGGGRRMGGWVAVKEKKDRRRCLSPPTSYTSARADPARFPILHTPPFLHPLAPFAPPPCSTLCGASASSSQPPTLTVHPCNRATVDRQRQREKETEREREREK